MRNYSDFAAKVDEGRSTLAKNHHAAYAEDYPAILNWFSGQKLWTADAARIGGLMVYGWMPTILRTAKSDFEKFADLLNREAVSEMTQPLLNASWVGTSKFLHFWRPAHFSIWDSKVCKVLGWGVLSNDFKKFSEYQSFCRRYSEENGTVPLRDIEQCLFLQADAGRNGKT
jgi:hypothetical protein